MNRQITEIIVHCSDTPAGRDDRAADIRRWHVNGNGWADIGYHYVVDLDGKIEAGRDVAIAGAHCTGHNAQSIGVCYVGGKNAQTGKAEDTRTEAQKRSLIILLAFLLTKYPNAKIYGHCDFSKKACPCFDAQTEYRYLCKS